MNTRPKRRCVSSSLQVSILTFAGAENGARSSRLLENSQESAHTNMYICASMTVSGLGETTHTYTYKYTDKYVCVSQTTSQLNK